mmetsp:Transcript_68393/g.189424  ORF Transcript_68393/g.189424 Transcript_68393/m.189424 type:complete len:227 (+) Transcript_68393:44-724(+)
MVLYFTARGGYTLYMGKNKYENENLIAYGWPEDIWFHVEDMSSAHVYLRLKKGEKWPDVPEEAKEDCAQLVKANSIEGCKKKSVEIVYTPWANLKKTESMAVGQIGFHNEKDALHFTIEKDKEIVKRLVKTKVERLDEDLAALKAERDEGERAERRAAAKEYKAKKKAEQESHRKEAEARSYKTLFEGKTAGARGGAGSGLVDADDMGLEATEDTSAAVDYEDDFM